MDLPLDSLPPSSNALDPPRRLPIIRYVRYTGTEMEYIAEQNDWRVAEARRAQTTIRDLKQQLATNTQRNESEVAELRERHRVERQAWDAERYNLRQLLDDEIILPVPSVSERMDRLEDEYEVSRSQLLTTFGEVLRQAVYGDLALNIRDLAPLNLDIGRYQQRTPPTGWSPYEKGHAAEWEYYMFPKPPLQRGYMIAIIIANCLMPQHFRTYNLKSVRAHVEWLDYIGRRPFPYAEDHQRILISCLEYHLAQLTTTAAGDGVSVAHASCLLVQLMCKYDGVDIARAAKETMRPLDQCSFLEAAELLRIQMAAHKLSGVIPDFVDHRFKDGIALESDLCTLDMSAFLRAVCARDIVGTTTSDPWVVNLSTGSKSMTVLAEHGRACFFFSFCEGSGSVFTADHPTIKSHTSLRFCKRYRKVAWDLRNFDGMRYSDMDHGMVVEGYGNMSKFLDVFYDARLRPDERLFIVPDPGLEP